MDGKPLFVRLRTLLALASLVAVLGVTGSAQDPAGSAASGRRQARPRIVAELSNLLTHSPLQRCSASASAPHGRATRVVSWNIRAARNAPIDAIAAELHAMEPDIVALQEVDVRTRRGGFVEQPEALARSLGFHHAFAASIKWDGGDYGLALLSRWPLVEVRRHRVPATAAFEPRIVLEASVCPAGGRTVRIFNHHADIREGPRREGFARVRAILEPHIGRGMIVAGDFNEPIDAPGVQDLLSAGLVTSRNIETDSLPVDGLVDHLLVDGTVAPHLLRMRIWPTDKSDHPAVIAELDW
jgi:endonuclease/exonuclease/phosphatase family metal-dependent hydrolase